MPDPVEREPKRHQPDPRPSHEAEEPKPPVKRDGIEPSKDRPSGPGDTGPGSTADRNVSELEP